MCTHPWIGVVCAAALMVTAGCGDDAEQPVFSDRDERFAVEPGERFTVTLESNVTTGYAWELSAEPPGDVVRLIDDEYVAPDSDLVGAGGHQKLTFEAVGDGSTFIQLWYVRSFDDPAEPADRAQFEVIVGSGSSDGATPPDDEDEPAAAIPDDEDAISVSELLASRPEGEVVVRGALFDDGSGLVVCGALAESFPPQCPGERVVIANPEIVTADFTQEGGVRWTDRSVVLLGRLVDGAFEVSAT